MYLHRVGPRRIEQHSDGRVRYRLRHPFHDGTRAVIFDPLTFIEKLCALIPPPRANLVTYHGVLAPNAAWRARVVPDSGSSGLQSSRKRCRKPLSDDAPASERKRHYTWAELMKRVFRVDVLECPCCKGKRKLITDPPVIRRSWSAWISRATHRFWRRACGQYVCASNQFMRP